MIVSEIESCSSSSIESLGVEAMSCMYKPCSSLADGTGSDWIACKEIEGYGIERPVAAVVAYITSFL